MLKHSGLKFRVIYLVFHVVHVDAKVALIKQTGHRCNHYFTFSNFASNNQNIMKRLSLAIGLMLLVTQAYSQGCSDAGFCTMGAMKPDQAYSKRINFKLRSVELSQYRGEATLTPKIYVTNLDFNFGINAKTTFQVKVPYQSVTGNLGETSGIGDLSFSFTRNLHSSEKFDINASIGTKIPTNKSDLKKGDFDFPMYYQVSLGSVDLIAGASLISKNWLFAMGYQQALTANNNHWDQGDAQRWIDDGLYHNIDYLKKHPWSTELKRGTDLMVRAERNFRFAKYNFNIGVLPIFRVTKDERLDEVDGLRKKMDNTTGMALSVLGGFGYHFSVNHSMKVTYGQKLVQREVNPDGLTRHNVMIVGYLVRF